jgi:endonuclease/exonuclease/phosphatase family metal-dependent hydrolase
MPKRHLFSVSLVLIFALAAPSVGQVDTTAVIAAWNLKGFDPIEDARIPRLAQAIADIDPAVIALSEVNPDDVVDKLIIKLSKLGACYQGKIIDQTSRQNLAILYKTGISVTNVQLLQDSDDGNQALRKALTANVRVGQFDFKIVAVHLKAGRTTNNRETRSRQATVIANFVETVTSGPEKDVLVVGDYNMIPSEDAVNFTAMNPTGFLRFVSSEDLGGQFSHISNATTGTGSLLDGYAISKDHTEEYIEGTLHIVQLPRYFGITLGQYDTDYSDHLPLAARFRITVDDD